MRISAKFNIFLGVKNLAVEIIPPHLQYLKSYFRRADLNPLMPWSLALGTVVSVWMAAQAFAAPVASFEAIGFALAGTMLALAVLEHVFLAIPVPDMVLWRWALKSHPRDRTPA